MDNEKRLWAEMRNIQFCLDYLILSTNPKLLSQETLSNNREKGEDVTDSMAPKLEPLVEESECSDESESVIDTLSDDSESADDHQVNAGREI